MKKINSHKGLMKGVNRGINRAWESSAYANTGFDLSGLIVLLVIVGGILLTVLIFGG